MSAASKLKLLLKVSPSFSYDAVKVPAPETPSKATVVEVIPAAFETADSGVIVAMSLLNLRIAFSTGEPLSSVSVAVTSI